MMKIVEAQFVISAVQRAQFPRDDLPQLAFCGRSNVGKSSLINVLINRKNLAKTSSTPGKTRQLNFYRITPAGQHVRSFYFVDLPGYGYAKVSQSERESWRRLIEDYFKHSAALCGALSIIDSRVGAMTSDMELLSWLNSLKLPVAVVATKADKLSNQQRAVMKRKLDAELAPFRLNSIVPFSAINGLGRKEIWQVLHAMLQG